MGTLKTTCVGRKPVLCGKISLYRYLNKLLSHHLPRIPPSPADSFTFLHIFKTTVRTTSYDHIAKTRGNIFGIIDALRQQHELWQRKSDLYIHNRVKTIRPERERQKSPVSPRSLSNAFPDNSATQCENGIYHTIV